MKSVVKKLEPVSGFLKECQEDLSQVNDMKGQRKKAPTEGNNKCRSREVGLTLEGLGHRGSARGVIWPGCGVHQGAGVLSGHWNALKRFKHMTWLMDLGAHSRLLCGEWAMSGQERKRGGKLGHRIIVTATTSMMARRDRNGQV